MWHTMPTFAIAFPFCYASGFSVSLFSHSFAYAQAPSEKNNKMQPFLHPQFYRKHSYRCGREPDSHSHGICSVCIPLPSIIIACHVQHCIMLQQARRAAGCWWALDPFLWTRPTTRAVSEPPSPCHQLRPVRPLSPPQLQPPFY